MPEGGATGLTAGKLAGRRGNWPHGHPVSHSRRLYRTFERSNTKGAKVVAGLAVDFPTLIIGTVDLLEIRSFDVILRVWHIECNE